MSRMITRLVMFIILIIAVMVTGRKYANSRDVDIDKILKRLNKPSLKSIKSPDGDIIDCVHMKNHPIYDHPLFKNHTIQMKPSSYPKGWNNKSTKIKNHSKVMQLWTINGKCPRNSIPIIRTRRKNLLQAESIERYGENDPKTISQPLSNNPPSNFTHEYAIARTYPSQTKYHGARADLSVWNPYIQTQNEFSVAQIWIVAGAFPHLNTIEAGWHVYPRLSGDNLTRFFIYWTAKSYNKSGCYNLRCPGFVHTNQEFAIGGSMPKVSVVQHEQVSLHISIWKDSHTGNWWLKLGSDQTLGYWPSSLFTHLQNSAEEINWGGEITNYKKNPKHTSTTMGSGRFANEGYKNASFFRSIEIIDEANISKSPERLFSSMTNQHCYNITINGFHRGSGFSFYYGGPGRNPLCN